MTSTGTDRVLAGRYQLEERLGRGGMAEVRGGVDLRLDRPVAVKILRPEYSYDPAVRERFESEARLAARLSHPNVVGVYDSGEEDDLAYIVMERLPGTTLADEIERGPLSEDRVRAIAHQVLAAVGAAHAAGLIHRDIKPANVLTCPDGSVKVTDFGIATVAGVVSTITAAGLVLGTPSYLSPERLEGSRADVRSDLYSVGALLYHALAGQKPYQGSNAVATAMVARDRAPVPLAELRPDAHPDLVAAIERAMARSPLDRYDSAAAMDEAFQSPPGGAAEGGDMTAVLPVATPANWSTETTRAAVTGDEWSSPAPGRATRPAFDGAEAALAALAASAWAWMRRQPRLRLGSVVLAALLLVIVALDLSGGPAHRSSGSGGATPPTLVAPTAVTTATTTATTTASTRAPAPPPGPAEHHHRK